MAEVVEVLDWRGALSRLGSDRPALILGNGGSMVVSSQFAYPTLLARAQANSMISPSAAAVFQKLNTTNFEAVLRTLSAARRVASVLHSPVHEQALTDLEDEVRDALAGVVHNVHPAYHDVLQIAEQYGDALLLHSSVFSLGYDLIVYWSMAARGFGRFWDGFSSNPFDPSTLVGYSGPAGRTAVYWPHGGLHLADTSVNFAGGGGTMSGETARKLLNADGSLLDQFKGVATQFVSEGSAEEKRTTIARSAYLRWYGVRLAATSDPLVLFGTELEADSHIAELIKLHERPVALGVYDPGSKTTAALTDIARYAKARFGTDEVYLFDSATHPIGQIQQIS